jgi:hypothetical protein
MKNERMDLKTSSIVYTPKCDVVQWEHRHFAKAEINGWHWDALWCFVFCVVDVSVHSLLFGGCKYVASEWACAGSLVKEPFEVIVWQSDEKHLVWLSLCTNKR